MLAPQKTKYLKYQKKKLKGITIKSTSSYKLSFGDFGIQAVESGLITPKQIESVRRTIIKNMITFGKVWIRVFPDSVITNKPNEVRMGRGKGDFKSYVFKALKGCLLFEAKNIIPINAKKALIIALKKLPIRCQIVIKGL